MLKESRAQSKKPERALNYQFPARKWARLKRSRSFARPDVLPMLSPIMWCMYAIWHERVPGVTLRVAESVVNRYVPYGTMELIQ